MLDRSMSPSTGRKFLLSTALTALSAAAPLGAATVLTNGVVASSVTASGQYLSEAPIKAFDNNAGTIWLNPGFPLAWIEVDLGSTYLISEGYFVVNMSPSGVASHQILISDNPILGNTTGATVAHSFTANFAGQILTPVFTGVEGRYVQIRTLSSPSWVSWGEIELLGTTPVPEPSSALLAVTAGLCLGMRRRRTQAVFTASRGN